MTSEEIRAEEYLEACERLAVEITEAIGRSVSHNEKVSVHIDASAVDMSDAFRIIRNLVSEYDTVRENDGSQDVWGTFEGEEFRLNLYTA